MLDHTHAGRLPRARSRALSALPVIARAALLALAFAGTVRADAPAGLAKFAGNYKYAGTRDQGIAVVDKAIDESLADLNMVMRLLVKRAIQDRFAETILIETPGDKIGIKVGDLDQVTLPIGKTERVTGKNGKSGNVTHTFDGSKITETVAGDQGTITNVFELSPDGKTLHRSVTVTGERMKKPVKYRLDYARQ